MKNVLCLGLLLCASGAASTAQVFDLKNLSTVGFEAGPTYSRIHSKADGASTEQEVPDDSQIFSTGLHFGAQVDYAVKKNLRLSVGLRFFNNSIRYRINDMEFTGVDSAEVRAYSDERHTMRFFSIPVSLTYVFSAGRIAPFLTVSTAANFYLGTREKYEIRSDADGAQLASGTLKHRVGAYNRVNFPLTIGGGARYPLTGKLDLGATLAYHHPLRRLLRKDFVADATHRVNYFTLGAGLYYRL